MLQASQKRTKRAPFSGERPPAGAYEDQFEGTAGPNDGLHRDRLKVMLSIYNEPTSEDRPTVVRRRTAQLAL